MNIHLLIQTVENLDTLITMTIDSAERDKLCAMLKELQTMLRSHGVFIGTNN